jgi:dihydrodipicolinate synthase/N-acetylneuraminate lyase
MLHSLNAGTYQRAEQIRGIFKALESLRDAISPVRVLHAAVELAGIARTGPIIPPLAGLNDDGQRQVTEAALKLLEAENTWR